MFRLLLVTDKEEIQTLYRRYPDWNQQGFEAPVVAVSADAGIRALRDQKIDAVSWLLPVREGKRFYEQAAPYGLFGLETVYDEAKLRQGIGNARRQLMSRQREQQTAEPDDVLTALRESYLREILRGNVGDLGTCAERKASLALSDIGADNPIAIASFRIPEGDRFYEERWKYGSLRLEYALNNVFSQGNGEVSVLSLINPHHMRVISLSSARREEGDMYAKMIARISRARRILEEGFDLSLQLKWVNSYPDLTAYTGERFSRAAH